MITKGSLLPTGIEMVYTKRPTTLNYQLKTVVTYCNGIDFTEELLKSEYNYLENLLNNYINYYIKNEIVQPITTT